MYEMKLIPGVVGFLRGLANLHRVRFGVLAMRQDPRAAYFWKDLASKSFGSFNRDPRYPEVRVIMCVCLCVVNLSLCVFDQARERHNLCYETLNATKKESSAYMALP